MSSRDPHPDAKSPSGADRERAIREAFVHGSAEALRIRFATLKGYGQLVHRQLQRTPVELERTLELADKFEQQLHDFEALLLAYLNAAHLQWRTPELSPAPVDLAALGQQSVQHYLSAPERTPQHSLYADAPAPVLGNWDEKWLGEAIAALLSNALKYSPDGGEVRLSVRRQNGHALVTVTDQGIGIPPDEQALVFRPFVRGSNATDVAPGIGLGLFITSRVADFHDGQLEVESTPSHGSTFRLRLPLEPRRPDA